MILCTFLLLRIELKSINLRTKWVFHPPQGILPKTDVLHSINASSSEPSLSSWHHCYPVYELCNLLRDQHNTYFTLIYITHTYLYVLPWTDLILRRVFFKLLHSWIFYWVRAKCRIPNIIFQRENKKAILKDNQIDFMYFSFTKNRIEINQLANQMSVSSPTGDFAENRCFTVHSINASSSE